MNDIKAVFFDFDWTLFDHKTRSFIPSAIESIKHIHQKGVQTFINSARSYYALEKLGTFAKMPFDGYVTNNGGAAFTKDKILYQKCLPSLTVDAILSIILKHNFSYLICTLKNTYLEEKDKNVRDYYKVFYEPLPKPMKEYSKNEAIISIQIFIEEKYDYLFSKIPSIYINRFFPLALEITSEPFKKSEGIKALIEDTKLKKEQLAAFGDDYNDIDMFSFVEHSVCMGNAAEEVKKKAKYVTSNIEDDGIKNGLTLLGLLS